MFEAVQKLAYSLWERRGRPIGSPETDWFEAERDYQNLMDNFRSLDDMPRDVKDYLTKGPDWVRYAYAYIGMRELPGVDFNNLNIVDFFNSTSWQPGDDETPWCSAFVNHVLGEIGYRTSGSAAAKSWLGVGVPLDGPQPGAMVVMTNNGKGHDHVGFVVGRSGDSLYVLGGNQDRYFVDIKEFNLTSSTYTYHYYWPQKE